MKRLLFCLLFFFLLFPSARGQELDTALADTLSSLPLAPWEEAYQSAFPEGEDLRGLILRLARGEIVLQGETLFRALADSLFRELSGSAQSCLQLMVPAIFLGVLEKIRGSFSRAALGESLQAACCLMLSAAMARDLGTHMRLSQQSVSNMADLMQALFPLLLTLLAAVGGTAGAAFFQPTVAAACGTMTALVRHVTLPLALAGALSAILNHLSPRMQVGRLSRLFQTIAKWTLGVSFTIFLSVSALQSLGAAAADGVSIRTAKYAVDHFVPVVGGMFADTMDTLVGASLLIKNALGITGLMLLLSAAAGPLIQTLSAVMLYRACAALLQPVTSPDISACIQDFSDVLMLFFIIQLSVAAMFLLLAAQMLAVGNLTVMLR